MIKSWMVIGAVALLVVALGGALVTPDGSRWFNRLQRPRWLTFEPAIPFIWTVIYICAAWSAYVVWESALGSRKTWLMLLYLLLELVTTAYTPVLFRLRSLKVGTIIGGTGAFLSIILALLVLPISTWASLLLVPYMIWSPIGTYTTWEMMQLNPDAV
jgi:tryptophan-rich sensory protein